MAKVTEKVEQVTQRPESITTKVARLETSLYNLAGAVNAEAASLKKALDGLQAEVKKLKQIVGE